MAHFADLAPVPELADLEDEADPATADLRRELAARLAELHA